MTTCTKRRGFTLAGVGILFLTGSVLADVPRLIHYQGKLVTSAGAILAGPVALRARLYTSPTAPTPVLFDEMHAAVPLNRGLFSILLGSQTGGGVPDSVIAQTNVYLGVAVDGAAELAPRIRIATSPYTLRAQAAETLVDPTTFDPAVMVAAGGRVGIGTATPDPSARLQIASTTGGFLPPAMTSAQRDAIASPAQGLQIFNTDTKCYNMWDGATWRQSCFECTFSPPSAGNNGPLCEGETLNLTATPVAGAAYAWTGPNGFSSTDQNPSVPVATTAATGPYSVTATVDGCTSNPVTTLVSISAIPAAPSITTNSPVCVGQALTFDASTVPGAIYSWTGPNGYTSSVEDPSIPNVTLAAAGSYTLQVSVNGCISPQAMTSVTVNQIPATPGVITGQTTGVCNLTGRVYTITDVPGATTYTWSVPSGASIAAGQGTAFLTVNFGTQSGNITVTAGNACGTSAASTLAVTADCPIYAFTSHTFTNCSQTGRTGPSVAQCRSAYSPAGAWDENPSYFNVTSGIQYWTVPATGTYRIEARGAQGANTTAPVPGTGGAGAIMAGDFQLTAGQTIRILVGQRGEGGHAESAPAGGGSFVVGGSYVGNADILVIAGGGGSASYGGVNGGPGQTSTSGQAGQSGGAGGSAGSGGAANGPGSNGWGNGGGGFFSDGGEGGNGTTNGQGRGLSWLNGGNGGWSYYNSMQAGFGGGGGGGNYGGGGGGGYSGGGAGSSNNNSGGGGGSYNAGSNQSNTTGGNTGQGSVIITKL